MSKWDPDDVMMLVFLIGSIVIALTYLVLVWR